MPTTQQSIESLINTCARYSHAPDHSRYVTALSELERRQSELAGHTGWIITFGELQGIRRRYVERASMSDEDRHFTERQRGRERRERDAEDRRRRQAVETMVQEIATLNETRTDENKFTTMCGYCHRGINENEEGQAYYLPNLNEVVCQFCIDRFQKCQKCEAYDDNSEMITTMVSGKRLCRKCQEGCVTCHDCEAYTDDPLLLAQHEGQSYCSGCLLELTNNDSMNDDEIEFDDDNDNDYYDDDPNWREYSTSKLKKFCSDDEGAIVKSPRIFSCELETMYPTSETFNKVMEKYIPKEVGADPDGSITEDGAEFQTPKLGGKNGEQLIRKVCGILNRYKFMTDKTCGLHVHFDGAKDFLPPRGGASENFNGKAVKDLFITYVVFEDVLHSFLPKSRRKNEYCNSLKKNFNISELRKTRSLEDIEKIWYRTTNKYEVSIAKSDSKHGTRYSGINFHTLLSDNHLEVRYHSGTINAKKILEWVNLHARIMDTIASGTYDIDKIIEMSTEPDVKEKMEYLFDLISLKESSRKYFLNRQEKFMVKASPKEEEYELADNE